jgi:glutamine amidotransferase
VIAIVDYGAGNVTSVRLALEHLGYEALVTCDPPTVESAERVIVPGVGHFRATATLADSPLRTAVVAQLLQHRPLLGICLGMQWLFEGSREAPELAGLGAFAGHCEPLPTDVKSPHIGWDELEIAPASRLFAGLAPGTSVYFAHGYYAPVFAETAAVCRYGAAFSAAVERDSLFGVQFHPEKSGQAGLVILDNFCRC